MDKKLALVIKYFAVFKYFPSFKDVYTFFPEKISKKKLKTIYEAKKYTPLEYSSFPLVIPSEARNLAKRKISKIKLNSWRFKTYIKILSVFPQIKLIGLSGSIAMMSTSLDDDIDLFIITQKKRLFTGRFLALIFAYLMGLKRKIEQKKAPGKICLNLFFDESNLRVPKFKQTEYVAHEVLQMKPIINKSYTYEKFLKANLWVVKLFPNASPPVIPTLSERSESKGRNLAKPGTVWNLAKRNRIGNWVEKLLKKLQLKLINRHKTFEIITPSQLWFHPDDFEKKLLCHSREGGNPDS